MAMTLSVPSGTKAISVDARLLAAKSPQAAIVTFFRALAVEDSRHGSIRKCENDANRRARMIGSRDEKSLRNLQAGIIGEGIFRLG
jgi:hypothetical protein